MSITKPVNHIRWMIRRDMESVLDIERRTFRKSERWSEQELVSNLRRRNTIGLIIESKFNDRDGFVTTGYVIYDLHKIHLDLLKLVVDPNFRRRGLGKALVEKLRHKMCPIRRNRIIAYVSEDDLESHLFLRATGFLAKRTLRKYVDRDMRDAYQFELSNEIPNEVLS